MQTLGLEYFDTKHPLFTKLNTLGIPKTKTEQYRNFPIKQILQREYNFKKLQYIQAVEGKKLVIDNGQVIEYPTGTKIIFDKTFEADENHYDSSYFISHMLTDIVIHIEILEDIGFEIQHIFKDKETLLSYRLVITTAANINVEIFESFKMQGSEKSFFLYGVDAEIADDSTMRWIRNENRDANEASLIGSHRYNVANRAALELKTFDFGSVNSLHLYKIDLGGYAWANASHLLLANKEARRGNVIQINHNREYAKSAQEARSILKDKATGIFDAKIRVDHQAKYSNAAQNSKAILLDENAHMYAKPQLEIYIDELEASHGSTIGTLDEEALFYLCSRGIRLQDARKMLVLAFANSLIDTVDNEMYAKRIHDNFEAVI